MNNEFNTLENINGTRKPTSTAEFDREFDDLTEINESNHDRLLSFAVFDDYEEYCVGDERDQTSFEAKMNREKINPKQKQETTEEEVRPPEEVSVLISTEETKQCDDTKDENELKEENSSKTNNVNTREDYSKDDIRRNNSLDPSNSGNQSGDHDGTDKCKFYVHSSFLSSQSSYFRALFYSGMQESFSKEVVMKVPKRELQAHKTLIEAMYNITALDDEEFYQIVQILLLAHKYDVDRVFKKCKQGISSATLTLEKSEFILEITAHITDRAEIKDTVGDCLVKEFFPLDKTWRSQEFRSLSKAALGILLSSNKLVVQSENTVFVALMWWIESHGFEDVRPLLSLVRFKLMSLDFLRDIVRHHEVAQNLDGFQEYLESGVAFLTLPSDERKSLKEKPTPRCSYISHEPVFSWIFDNDEWKRLLNEEIISSSGFWVVGYKMHVQLNFNESSNTFELFLFVDNLTSDNHIIISWKATSNLFQKYKISCSERKYYNSVKGNGYRYIKSSVPASSLKAQTTFWSIDVWLNVE